MTQSNEITKRPLSPIEQLRRVNLGRLYELHGGPTRIANLLGLKSASYLSQLASGHRPIKEGRARTIEETLKLPHGWMDTKQESSLIATTATVSPVDAAPARTHGSQTKLASTATVKPSAGITNAAPSPNLVTDTVMSVGSMLEEAGLDVSPATFAIILDLVLANAQASGNLNEDFLRKIIALLTTFKPTK